MPFLYVHRVWLKHVRDPSTIKFSGFGSNLRGRVMRLEFFRTGTHDSGKGNQWQKSSRYRSSHYHSRLDDYARRRVITPTRLPLSLPDPADEPCPK